MFQLRQSSTRQRQPGRRPSDGLEESPANSNDEGQQANESDNGTENESEDEKPNTNGTEDGDGESPDVDEVEQRDVGEDVIEFGDLRIINLEEQTEEREHDDEQASYTGEIENAGEEVYSRVEVRVYNGDGTNWVATSI